MTDSAQPYTTEHPEPFEGTVERNEVEAQGSIPVYEADPTRLDLTDGNYVETRVTTDEVVGPDHPAAVIIPPEGRTPEQEPHSEKSPLQLLDSGEADEATAVLDGETVTSSEGEQKEADFREKYGSASPH